MRSNLLLLSLGVAVLGAGAAVPSRGMDVPTLPAVLVPAPVAGPVAKEDAGEARVKNAVSALAKYVTRSSNEAALETALGAYYAFKAAHPEQVRKPYLYFVDYGLDNRTARGYVFDMERLALVEGPFVVAHGRGSSNGKNAVPMRFSNRSGSAATSLGLYVAGETYGFSGHAGGVLYHSIGLRLDGKSGEFNSRARARGVVVHGAPYVTASGSGRSEGCPAMEQARARRLIPKIANGGVVFLYSPNDSGWLARDRWING